MSSTQWYAVACMLSASAMALVIANAATGCGFESGLYRAHEGLKIMSREVEPMLADECMKRARKCKREGIASAEQCQPLVRCRALKKLYALGASGVHKNLGVCNGVYIEMKQAGIVK